METTNTDDIPIELIRGSRPASEHIKETKKYITPETVKLAGDCVRQVEEHIKNKGFDLLLFTGRSGFIADKLISDQLPGVQKAWLEKQDKRYNDPRGVLLMLDELGVNPSECSLLIIDDHMTSGIIKAGQSLLGLSKAKLKNYGFASFIGPFKYHRKPDLQQSDLKIQVTRGNQDLANRLFSPALKNQNVWELLSDLERLADYYEQSNMVRDFIDTTLSQIKKQSNNIVSLN